MKMRHSMIAMFMLVILLSADGSAQDPVIAVPPPAKKAASYAQDKIVTPIKSEKAGVTIVQTEYFGGLPPKFEGSVISGKGIKFDAPGCMMMMDGKGTASFQKIPVWKNYTDGKFAGSYFLTGTASQIKMLCETPIRDLSHVRITVNRVDPARSKLLFSLIVLIDGKWVPITQKITQKAWLAKPAKTPRRYQAYLCYDFTFEKGSVPSEIGGIGILDESNSVKFGNPRYAQIEAK